MDILGNTACSLDDAAHCSSHTSTIKDTCGDLHFHCDVGDCINIAFVSYISIISYEYVAERVCPVSALVYGCVYHYLSYTFLYMCLYGCIH